MFVTGPTRRVNRCAGAFLLLTGAGDLMWHLMWYAPNHEIATVYALVGQWYAMALPILTLLLVHVLYPPGRSATWRRLTLWGVAGACALLAIGFTYDRTIIMDGVVLGSKGDRFFFRDGPWHGLLATLTWSTQAAAVVASAKVATSRQESATTRKQAATVGLAFLLLVAHTGASITGAWLRQLALGRVSLEPAALLAQAAAVLALVVAVMAAPRILPALDGRARAWATAALAVAFLAAAGDNLWALASTTWGVTRPAWWPWWRMGLVLTSASLLALGLIRFGLVGLGEHAQRRVQLLAQASLLLLAVAIPVAATLMVVGGSHVGVVFALLLGLVGVTLAPAPHRTLARAVSHVLAPPDPETAAGERAKRYLDALTARQHQVADDPALSKLREDLGITEHDHSRLLALARERRRHPDATPPLLGRYIVERELGRGAFGTALLARDIGTGRHVVLKRFHSKRGEAQGLDEARALARVRHPRVVPLLAVERAADEVFLVLAHVSGGTVEALLQREHHLTPARAVDIMDDVLSGLAALHGARLAHGDVKPTNILIDEDGRAVLTDLGASRDVGNPSDEATLTASPLIGSFATVAPEIMRGQRRAPAGDVYAAGAVLYRLLTGEDYLNLRGHNPVEIMHTILHAPPRLAHPLVPTALEPVIQCALDKHPERRYRGAAEMRAALRAAAHLDAPPPDGSTPAPTEAGTRGRSVPRR